MGWFAGKKLSHEEYLELWVSAVADDLYRRVHLAKDGKVLRGSWPYEKMLAIAREVVQKVDAEGGIPDRIDYRIMTLPQQWLTPEILQRAGVAGHYMPLYGPTHGTWDYSEE